MGIELNGQEEKPEILVIDRSESARQAVVQLLEPTGFETVVADGFADGLARAIAQPPDAIVTELEMVGASGLDLVGKVRSHPATADVKIIVSSTHAFEQDRQASWRC